MDILIALTDIEKLETKLSELYEYFSRLLSDNPALASLFKTLSEEEKSHYDLIQYQKRLIRKNKELFKGITIDVAEIRQILIKADSLLNAALPLSAEEAIQAAIEFEKSAAEYHYRTAMQQANPEVAAFLNSLGGYDDGHAHSLTEFLRKT
jgi:rubrerythrin